jgi:hypothetical protein
VRLIFEINRKCADGHALQHNPEKSASAGDLTLALDLIAGPDDADALAYKLVLATPRHTDL